MACNVELRKELKPYPRTCADCRLGPCAKGYRKNGGHELPSSLPALLYVVRNEQTQKIVVTSSEAEAEKLADLINGKWEEAPVVSIPR